jgi:capping protein alpha
MAEDFQEATPEERLRIASHFILSSPNGEVDDVIADVKTLMGQKSLLTDNVIEKLLKQYNTENYVFAALPGGKNLPVSKFGHVEGNKYADPSSGQIFQFDHINRKWAEEKTAGPSGSNASLRGSIDKAVNGYCGDFYNSPRDFACAIYDKEDTIVVVISATRVNLGNFWSGGWKSTHTLDVKSGALKSLIQASVHYFEEGNVQLNSNYEEQFKIKGSGDAAAKEIVDSIKSVENTFQKKLEELFHDMHTESFKAMRRFLPVTRNKMDWNPNAHRIRDQITR